MRLYSLIICVLTISYIATAFNPLLRNEKVEKMLEKKFPRAKRDILDYLNVMDFEWVQRLLEKFLGDLYVDITEGEKSTNSFAPPEEVDSGNSYSIADLVPAIELVTTTEKPTTTTTTQTTTTKTTPIYNTPSPKPKTAGTKAGKSKTSKTTTEAPFLGTTTTRLIPTTIQSERQTPYKIIAPNPTRNTVSFFKTATSIPEELTSLGSTPSELTDFCAVKCGIPTDCGTSEKLVKYARIQNSVPEEVLKVLAKETQIIEKQMLPLTHKAADAEVVQFTMNLLRAYRPTRSLVIGVFTGYALMGIALVSDPRGIVVGLEDPELVDYWDAVGKKTAHQLSLTSRIQVRAMDTTDRELQKLVQYEPTAFDFILLDDFKYSNYLTHYEMAINLLRTDGVLIVASAFTDDVINQRPNEMTEDTKTVHSMNYRIKNDARVSATLLPMSQGTWFIVKK
uniref:Catechol O-methyltransferase n=1 Tax=Rhabditophanes sp. KR3021 TaxID=114890 RepID=A0AC35U5F7_9BILA